MKTKKTKKTKVTVEIVPVKTRMELYEHIPGQTQQQSVYVELDCGYRILRTCVDSEIGNGVPSAVWHGHWQRWEIPALRMEAANELLTSLGPLAARVCDGYERHWDGSNHVARFDDDALEAMGEIAELCERCDDEDALQVWEADQWLARDDAKSLGITADTTNKQLDELETDLLEQARTEDVDYVRDLDKHLARLRDEVRAEAADEDEDAEVDAEVQS